MDPAGVGDVERGQHGGRPDPARNQGDVGDVGAQRGHQGRLLAPAVRGHDDRGDAVIVDVGAAVRPVAGLDGQAQRSAEGHQGLRDRGIAHDHQPGRRPAWLEEDLQGAAGDARVGHRDRTRLDRCVRGTGLDPQQQRLAGDQHLEGVHAQGALGARTADEALNLPVGVHERRVAGVGTGRVQGTYDGGLDERDAGLRQLGSPGRQAGHHEIDAIRWAAVVGPAWPPIPGPAYRACPCASARTAPARRPRR